MKDQPLADKTVALLVANGFEEVEMTEIQRALLAAGATPKIVSHEQALVNGWHGNAWGHFFPIDVTLSSALAADFDGLVVPGGGRGVERLLSNAHAKRFVRGFLDGAKPVITVGHGALVLAAVERAAGRTVAAADEVAEQLTAAGARISPDPVATDKNLLTARADAGIGTFRQAAVGHMIEVATSLVDAAA